MLFEESLDIIIPFSDIEFNVINNKDEMTTLVLELFLLISKTSATP